jgi:lysophospholipase L1-like esterase
MKKRFFFLLVVLFASHIGIGQITNQRLFDTIPFMVDHYAKRMARFESERIQEGSIVFLGNSITEGGDWKKLTGDTKAANRGIGGDITFGVMKRLTEIVIARPSKVFLLIGINDIGKDIPDAVIADNIRKIVDRINREAPSTRVYVQTILPVNPLIKNFPQHYDKNEHVKSTNVLIQKALVSVQATLINTNKLFSDAKGFLNEEFTSDGLHLNAAGYTYWVAYLKTSGALK